MISKPKHEGNMLTPQQVADMLQISVPTLARWRTNQSHGLPYVKVGGAVRYRRADVESWIENNTVTAD